MDVLLSERARSVMDRARDEALRLGHEYVGTEHILLGISSEGGGLASECLEAASVTPFQARAEVEKIIGLGPLEAVNGDPWQSPRASHVINLAREAALRQGKDRIDPEHLLFGLTQEEGGVAAQVIRALGSKPEFVRERLRLLMERNEA